MLLDRLRQELLQQRLGMSWAVFCRLMAAEMGVPEPMVFDMATSG